MVLATESERTENRAFDDAVMKPVCDTCANGGGREHLHDGAGECDFSHIEQIAHGKMQPHAEHEQDNADFRELLRQRDIGNESGRTRTDCYTCQQITENGRQLQILGDHAENERGYDAGDNGVDKRMLHRRPL